MVRRHGQLSDDDLALWRQVARSATPLEGARDGPVPQPKASATPRDTPAFRIAPPPPSRDRDPGHDLAPTLESQIAAQPLRMDRKTFTRMKRGKLKPQRKLDLHGMTLAQAHPALRRFVRQAHADGLRLVVVVTGKGSSARDEGGPIPTPRGVLRHHVPGWLAAPDLRPFVLQVTDAHARHGGGGAYYVYLTRGPAAAGPRG